MKAASGRNPTPDRDTTLQLRKLQDHWGMTVYKMASMMGLGPTNLSHEMAQEILDGEMKLSECSEEVASRIERLLWIRQTLKDKIQDPEKEYFWISYSYKGGTTALSQLLMGYEEPLDEICRRVERQKRLEFDPANIDQDPQFESSWES